MCKLVLNVGDTVRNINKRSCRFGWVGVVVASNKYYGIEYNNGQYQQYGKGIAHNYIEKLVSECPCQQQSFKIDLSKIEERVLANPEMWAHSYGKGAQRGTPAYILEAMGNCLGFDRIQVVHDEIQITQPKRRVLKKVRRNVIIGKTQDDFVREMGHAKGVQQFNTRALGKSTGQALHAIGSAMMNPGTEIRISKIDHAREQPGCSTSWSTLDKHFRALVQSLLGDMKGFTFTDTHIVFNPIVTEETYVES